MQSTENYTSNFQTNISKFHKLIEDIENKPDNTVTILFTDELFGTANKEAAGAVTRHERFRKLINSGKLVLIAIEHNDEIRKALSSEEILFDFEFTAKNNNTKINGTSLKPFMLKVDEKNKSNLEEAIARINTAVITNGSVTKQFFKINPNSQTMTFISEKEYNKIATQNDRAVQFEFSNEINSDGSFPNTQIVYVEEDNALYVKPLIRSKLFEGGKKAIIIIPQKASFEEGKIIISPQEKDTRYVFEHDLIKTPEDIALINRYNSNSYDPREKTHLTIYPNELLQGVLHGKIFNENMERIYTIRNLIIKELQETLHNLTENK